TGQESGGLQGIRTAVPATPVRSAGAVSDAAVGEVVRRQLDGDRVAGEDTDVMLAHLAGDVSGHDMAVLQLDPEHGIGQGLDDFALHLDRLFFCHSPLSQLWLCAGAQILPHSGCAYTGAAQMGAIPRAANPLR